MAKWLNKLNVFFNNNNNPNSYDFGVDFDHVFLNENDESNNTTITDTLKNFYDKCQIFFKQRMFMLYSTSVKVPPTESTIMEWYCVEGTGWDTKINTTVIPTTESNNG